MLFHWFRPHPPLHPTPKRQCASLRSTSVVCSVRQPRASPPTSNRSGRNAVAHSCCTTGWRVTATDAAPSVGSASSHITASPA